MESRLGRALGARAGRGRVQTWKLEMSSAVVQMDVQGCAGGRNLDAQIVNEADFESVQA